MKGTFPVILISISMLGCDSDGVLQIPRLPEVGEAQAASFDSGVTTSIPQSHVAFVFREGIQDIVEVLATFHIQGVEEPLSAKMHVVGDELVVAMTVPLGKAFRPHFRFLSRSGETVAEYRAMVNPDRHLITFNDQPFGTDEQFPYHALPSEVELEVDGAVHLSLEDEYRLWVGDRFLNLRGVVYLPNSQLSPLGVMTSADPESSTFLWTPVEGEAIPLEQGQQVLLEGGSTLTVGVSRSESGSISVHTETI